MGEHAGLGGKAHQATRRVTVGLGRHHKHRVVQHRDQLVESFVAHIAIMTHLARRILMRTRLRCVGAAFAVPEHEVVDERADQSRVFQAGEVGHPIQHPHR